MNFDINKKSVKIMLAAAVGLIFFAFLSYVSMEAGGQSRSWTILSGDIFFEEGFGFVSFTGLICIAALVGILATAYMKKTNENLLCCLAGGAAGVIHFIASLITFGNLEDKMGGMVSIGGGIGFWIGTIALIACAAMAFLLPEDAE